MWKLAVIATAVIAFSRAALAQGSPRNNVFFGYSYENTELTPNRVNLNGWDASLERKLFPFVSFVADVSGHYGSSSPSGTSNVYCSNETTCGPIGLSHEHDILFGPRVSVSVGRLRPFGEVLLGVGLASASGFSGTNYSFASAFGGGLDYRIVKPVAWRFQADYVRTSIYSFTQNNFRFSTGIVLRF